MKGANVAVKFGMSVLIENNIEKVTFAQDADPEKDIIFLKI